MKKELELNKLNSLKVIWTEFNNDENKSFNSFDELQEYVLLNYTSDKNLPSDGCYDKMKLEINFKNDVGIVCPIFFGGLSRIDIGFNDFNPFKEHIRDYILKDYNKREDKVLTYGDTLKFSYNFENIA